MMQILISFSASSVLVPFAVLFRVCILDFVSTLD